MGEQMSDQAILDEIGNLDVEGCDNVIAAATEHRDSLLMKLAASFKAGDEVEYPASSGTVLNVEGKYVGILHHGVTSNYPSVYVLASDVSRVFDE